MKDSTCGYVNTWVNDNDPITIIIATDKEIQDANDEFTRTFRLPRFDKIDQILNSY
jgi:hypothetical protein